MKKRQLDEAQAKCASSAALTAWQTINWVSCEKEVRKLQSQNSRGSKGKPHWKGEISPTHLD